MKNKIKFVLIALFCITAILSGCRNTSDNSQNAQNTENTNTEITFSGDDLALYSNEYSIDGADNLIVYLYEPEDNIPYDDENIGDWFNQIDLGFEQRADGNNVQSIIFNGYDIPIMTAKGIKTTGLNFFDPEKCSDEQEVIDKYGLKPDDEEIYYITGQGDIQNKFIAVYFNVTSDKVERVSVPKGNDLRNFDGIDANAYIYFEIIDGKVGGIIMRHKNQ